MSYAVKPILLPAPRLIATLAAALALSACTTSRSKSGSGLSSSGPRLVYEPVPDSTTAKRSTELQQHGYSKTDADRKAQRESSAQAWHYEDPQAWAREKDREARSAAREKMEKDLAKLDPK